MSGEIVRKLTLCLIDKGHETNTLVDMSDVYTEIGDLCSQKRITKFAVKEVSRKYAFELPDVPAEADYLKVLYDYERKCLFSRMRSITRILISRNSLRTCIYWRGKG